MGLFVTLSEANICIDLVFSVVEQTSLIFGSPSIDMSTNNTCQQIMAKKYYLILGKLFCFGVSWQGEYDKCLSEQEDSSLTPGVKTSNHLLP